MRRITLTLAACALVLAVSGATLPVAAQETAPFHKSATAATVLSVLVPGAGHLYTGETGKGLALLGIGVGGFAFGAYMWQRNVVDDLVECPTFDCAVTSTSNNSAWAYAGMLAYLGTWVYGVADAGSSAHRMNERNARSKQLVLFGTAVEPVAGPTQEGFALGLRVSTR
jgi:hypothetical protein